MSSSTLTAAITRSTIAVHSYNVGLAFVGPTTTTRCFASQPKRYPRHYRRRNKDGGNHHEVPPLRGKKSKEYDDANELYRADRVLANRSGMTRSECFNLLKQKRIYEVISDRQEQHQNTIHDDNNSITSSPSQFSSSSSSSLNMKLVAGPSEKLSMFADLRIDRVNVVPLPPPLLMVYHKPKWVLSVRKDPVGRPCLDSQNLLPDMHPVGRLDYDTSGLLLFSSSGTLTQILLHPKHSIEKEYVAIVTGHIQDQKIFCDRLAAGVKTSDGTFSATLLDVKPFPSSSSSEDSAKSVRGYLDRVRSEIPNSYNQTDLQLKGYLDVFDAKELSMVRLQVTEGKYRMVRRILANTGHPVVSLQRIRLGDIKLDGTTDHEGKHVEIPEGSTRPLSTAEMAWANSLLPSKSGSKQVVRKNKKKSS